MGNPFIHIELSTDDVGAAKKFYKSVFDWKLSDVPQMDYTMLDVGKGVGGGMTKTKMPMQPTAWLPYVQVTDVKKAIEKAKAAGANVLVEYLEIGTNMGAIGVFQDPAGGHCGVWAVGKPAKKAAPKKAAPKKAAKSAGHKKAAKKPRKR
jgi:predicted enzyme related to lactoylglutathione lyase